MLRKSTKITDKAIPKIINNEPDIKLGQFTQEEIDVAVTKIKNRKADDFEKIPSEISKTRKFDNLFLQYCNTEYKIKVAPSLSSRNETSEFPRTIVL